MLTRLALVASFLAASGSTLALQDNSQPRSIPVPRKHDSAGLLHGQRRASLSPNRRRASTPRSAAAAMPSTGFPYGQQPVRGVNLGGWLVLEPWITPSIFDSTGDSSVVDEWTYGLKYGSSASSRLQSHWNTWITASDFSKIASYGLNHVRIPIGYWAIIPLENGEPYATGQYEYLTKAVQWAKQTGIKVMIDLHGAPGSQNGYDNSGHRGNISWELSSDNVQRTRDAIAKLNADFNIAEYAGVVTSIELLNEPAGYVGQDMLSTVRQYYYDGYGETRYPEAASGSSQQSGMLVTIHDAFQQLDYWNGFMPSNSFSYVALDTHYYTIFTYPQITWSDNQRIQAVCNFAANMSSSNANLWTIGGEWAPADTDCAKYLNGRGVGARYDGTYPSSYYIGSCTTKTGSASSFSSSYKTFLRQNWEAHVESFEKGSGWIMWTWKTENGTGEEWSYQKGIEYGWIPKNPTDRQYPNICQSS